MTSMSDASYAQRFIEGCHIDWSEVLRDSYLRGIRALAHMGQLRFTHQVTFLAGANGTGKSTLLEALAVAYEDTESYQITRLFLDDREGLLRRLFQE